MAVNSKNINYMTQRSRVLIKKIIVAQLLKNAMHFMEPKASLPCLQNSVNGPSSVPGIPVNKLTFISLRTFVMCTSISSVVSSLQVKLSL
jgi:hypothetical protein